MPIENRELAQQLLKGVPVPEIDGRGSRYVPGKGVWDLVRAVTALGFQLNGARQGSLDWGHPYPWVSVFNLFNISFAHVVDRYNAVNEIKWNGADGHFTPVVGAHTEDELEALRKSGDELALYLYTDERLNQIAEATNAIWHYSHQLYAQRHGLTYH